MIDLPQEIIEHILLFCSPRDVSSFAQTYTSVRSIIYDAQDHHLWRQLFLAVPFDDLRSSLSLLVPQSNLDWGCELKDRLEAESILTAASVEHNDEAADALDVVLRTIHHALPAGPTLSANLEWATRVLSSCALLTSTTIKAHDPQAPARILAYMGLTQFESSQSLVFPARARNLSRCFVYDLRNYTQETDFSIYRFLRTENGRHIFDVNWVHVMHCVNVIVTNLWDLHPGQVLPPRGLEATRAYSAPASQSRVEHDWAGVEGVWNRLVCFMDYRALFSFNFSQTSFRCNPGYFDDENFHEGTRLIELQLRIMDNNDVRLDLHPPPEKTADKSCPRLYIVGFSHGSFGQHALVKGHIDKHADGTIQWAFVSIYDQRTSWLFDGVQLGNACSAMGVVGSWTATSHQLDDPNGPSWIWKTAGREALCDLLRLN